MAQLHDLLGAGVVDAKPLAGWSSIVSQGGGDPGSGSALDAFRLKSNLLFHRK